MKARNGAILGRIAPALALSIATVGASASTPRLASAAETSTVAEQPSFPPPSSDVRLHPDDPAADHTGTPPLPPNPDEPVFGEISSAPGEKRPVPNYDGREAPATTAGDVLIWVPRTIFFVPHLVLEWGLRKPVIGLITLAEKHKIFARLGNLFTFRDGKSAIFPTALFDFGLSPSIGFYSFHDDVGYPGHTITLQGGFWGDNWIRLVVGDHWTIFDGNGQFFVRGDYMTRPDDAFYGVGYDSQYEDRGNLRFRRLDGEIGLSSYVSGLSQAGIYFRARNGKLGDGQAPRFTEFFDPATANGFEGDGYQLLSFVAHGAFDSRAADRAFSGGTGVRVEVFGSYNFAPGESDVAFLRFGQDSSIFVDLTGRNHVLGLSVYVDLIEKTGSTPAPLPVSELIQLGGTEYLRGYLPGRFRGESAFVAALDYRYPVWIIMDADLFMAVGNTFGPNLEDFGWRRLVFNAGMALRTSFSRDTSIDALFAVGTNRFEESDFQVDNVRITVGVNHGF